MISLQLARRNNCKAVSQNVFPSHKIAYNTYNLQNPLKSAMAYTWRIAGLLSLLFQRKRSYNLICIGYNSHRLWFKCTIKGNIHSRQNPITKLLLSNIFKLPWISTIGFPRSEKLVFSKSIVICQRTLLKLAKVSEYVRTHRRLAQ